MRAHSHSSWRMLITILPFEGSRSHCSRMNVFHSKIRGVGQAVSPSARRRRLKALRMERAARSLEATTIPPARIQSSI